MSEPKNLGVIKTVHPSGMRETDKGHKVFEGSVGDTVLMEPGKKAYIVKAGEVKKETAPQKTELDNLREEATALGVEGAEKMNKATVVKAIADKKADTPPPPPTLPLGSDGSNGGEQ